MQRRKEISLKSSPVYETHSLSSHGLLDKLILWEFVFWDRWQLAGIFLVLRIAKFAHGLSAIASQRRRKCGNSLPPLMTEFIPSNQNTAK
jgi:hypothetical protein